MIKLIKDKTIEMYIKLIILILLVVYIIYNFYSKEKFNDFTEEEKEMLAKLAERDFNSEKVEYYKTPYKCLDYADMVIYD